jgi:hypothetical protein
MRIGLLAGCTALILTATAVIASRDQPLVALGCLTIGLVALASAKIAAEAHTSTSASTHRVNAVESGLTRQREQHADLAERAERDLDEIRAQSQAATERLTRLEQRVRNHWRQSQIQRLAISPQQDPNADIAAVDASSVRAVVEAIESGAIPSEQISDAFPEASIGLSGRRFRTLISALVGHYSERGAYLEIGTYLGKTICTSALANPSVRHIGVDDFSQVNEGGRNRDLFLQLVRTSGATNIDFFEEDFVEFLTDRTLARTRDISVYYFDASHDYRSQLLALLHGSRQTIAGGVMLVDDCNYAHVRAASYDFCASHPEWALLFERYTAGHPSHVETAADVEQRDDWWNGVHVLVHDPRFQLERLERQPDQQLDQSFRSQHTLSNCYVDDVRSRLARPRDDSRG